MLKKICDEQRSASEIKSRGLSSSFWIVQRFFCICWSTLVHFEVFFHFHSISLGASGSTYFTFRPSYSATCSFHFWLWSTLLICFASNSSISQELKSDNCCYHPSRVSPPLVFSLSPLLRRTIAQEYY